MERRLYRSRTDRVIWGVCGGLAKYFDVDPVLIRIIFVVLAFAGGFAVLAYIIMAIVIPLEGSTAASPKDRIRENVMEMRSSAEEAGREIHDTFTPKPGEQPETAKRTQEMEEERARDRRRNIIGIIIIAIGIIFLLGSLNIFWWLHWGTVWPLIIIVVGLLIIISTRRR